LAKADRSPILEKLGLSPGAYNVLTLHRPSNVDDPAVFGHILDALDEITRDLPVVFPIHPRTLNNLSRSGLKQRMERMIGLRLVAPLGYLDFLKLMGRSAVVLTDSGGIQEETTILGVWCLTLRENTERPVTVTDGTNRVVGTDAVRIVTEYRHRRETPVGRPPVPDKWDGRAAERIAAILAAHCSRGPGG
jgi:UDP-N-acetylglucosamine 2-epimerase (non-hydrolysing)